MEDCPEFEEVISDHVLQLILHWVPFDSLLSAASLVNSRWRAACASQDLWLTRLAPSLRAACCSASSNRYSSSASGPCLLYHALYRTNLLLNPSLQLHQQLPNRVTNRIGMVGRGRTPWFTMDSWRWEGSAPEGIPASPEGCVPLPPPPLPQYAQHGPVHHAVGVLAAPNNWASMTQVVDLDRELQRRGVPMEAATAYLDSSPPMELILWHSAHEHGRATCEVWLALDDGKGDISSWLKATDVAGGLYDAFATTGIFPCAAGQWQRVTLRMQGYPPGCRRATVVLKGQGASALLQQNVGVFGPKFAAPTLRLLPPEEVLAP